MAFTDGSKHKARAVGDVVLGESGKKGTPFIELYFEVTDGENKGGHVRWTGYFGEGSSTQRTIESLQYMGWKGDDLSEFSDGALHGLDTNEVQIVVELETYEKEGEQKTVPRVQWVNKLGGFLNVKNAMPKDQAASFGEKMRGLVLKTRAKQTEDSGTDFPPKEEAPIQQKKASGTKKGW